MEWVNFNWSSDMRRKAIKDIWGGQLVKSYYVLYGDDIESLLPDKTVRSCGDCTSDLVFFLLMFLFLIH